MTAMLPVLQHYHRIFHCVLLLLIVSISTTAFADNETIPESVAPLKIHLSALNGKNFSEKRQAVETIAELNSEKSHEILTALMKGNLFADNEEFYLPVNNQYYAVLSDQTLQEKPNNAKKVIINNGIRSWIKDYMAQNQLISSSRQQRFQAMQNILASGESGALTIVKKALPQEKDPRIHHLMLTYIARIDLQQDDISRHSSAIQILGDAALPENLSLLNEYTARAPSEYLKEKAEHAISDINTKLSLIENAQTLSYGLSLGSILILTAIGLSITFGVMGVINMAHGELMMIGAYTTYVVQLMMPNHITASIFVSLPVAFFVSAFVGILIEVCIVRHLYGRPLETLLATFGVSLILQQAVRSIFSPLNRLVQTPEFMQGEWIIMPNLSITLNRVYIFAFCLICFFVLLLVMKRSRLGLEVGAVSQNRAMARAMGINDRKVDMLTFGLGSGIAGLAGVALSQLTNVGPNLGQQYIVDSFMVVVTGGVGNLWGTFFSGLGLGVLNKFLEPSLGAVLAKTVVLVLIILFIQKYPRGLFPQKGRAAE